MTRFACIALLASAALGQTPAASQAIAPAPPATITVRSSLVVVPALVRTRAGQLVYTLQADDFILTDDGIPQPIRLEQDTGEQPLALVIVVQTGGDGAAHLDQYRDLGPMLDNLAANIQHKVAVVSFDSTPVLAQEFTASLNTVNDSLNALDAGDGQAATLDALAFAVDLLRTQPPAYRRAILLLSETADRASHTSLADALRAISDTNTVIYSVGFAVTAAHAGREARKFGYVGQPPLDPGPAHGCFSRDLGTDADGKPIQPSESRASQNFNCFAELLPPLRLGKIAEMAAHDALAHNISESVAHLTGGEFYKFKNAKTLERDLLTIANHVPNRYVLTFQPQSPAPGFHAIALKLKNYPDMSVETRNGYWVNANAEAAPPQP